MSSSSDNVVVSHGKIDRHRGAVTLDWLEAQNYIRSFLNLILLPIGVLIKFDFSTERPVFDHFRKILELEEELKVVGNNMKSLEISEQEVRSIRLERDHYFAILSSPRSL